MLGFRSLLAPLGGALVVCAVGCAATESDPFPSPIDDLRAFPRALAQDSGRVFTDRQSLGLLALGGVGALLSERDPLEGRLEALRERGTYLDEHLGSALDTAGMGATLLATSGLLYGWGRLSANEPLYRSSKRLLRALSLTGLSTLGLKTLIGDPRPDTGDSNGFPSGHSSMSMAFAVGVQRSFGWAWGLPAYALSAAIGLQRLDSGRHDLDDVIFGWTLGFVVSRAIFREEAPEEGAPQLGLFVDPQRQAAGLSLSWSF